MESTAPKHDKLDNYILLQTLGSGTYSKVRLAVHEETKKKFAIKIHKKENFEESHGEVLETELKTMLKLNGISPYIVNLVDY